MNTRIVSLTLVSVSVLATGCATTCGPGTVETEGSGWQFGLSSISPNKVCLPVSPVSDCTDFQMIEADGGGWAVDRDGGGHRVDRDGGGGRKERDEPHHPADAGSNLNKLSYVPSATCRIGVDAPPPEIQLEILLLGPIPKEKDSQT